ncbi:cytochrome P450 [Aspergillus keveii]|uniref:Cytochrome P450 n=1 Tax=Aspergillus keveii TaxID=714993 RepID=A0ABR4FIG9_9EURO
MSFSTHLICALCAALIWVTGLCLYRIFLHPLHRHPGPLLATLTDWYAAYYTWRGDIHLKLREFHGTYGTIVRFGPNSISINSYTGMSEIYSTWANVVKADAYSIMSASRHILSTISCIDKKQHAAKRKVLARLFTETALKGVEDRVLSYVDTFCASLSAANQAGWGIAKDIAAWSDYLTLDIISDLCYGKAFGLLRAETHRYIPKVISCVSRRNAICFVQPIIAKYKLDRIFLSTVSTQIRQFGSWIKDQADARKSAKNAGDSNDFFAHLSTHQAGKGQSGLTPKEVWVELLQLVIAGADTTAVAISAVFFHLLRDPMALSQATEEILSTFQHLDDIRPGALLRSCAFLHACINESLRLSPRVTGLAPRKVLTGGINVDGVHFPEGTIIGSPIYTLHRNATYFPQPDSFMPERRLQSQNGVDSSRVPFCPFSVGPRLCVAKRLALDEISVTVARTLYLYGMRLDEASSRKMEYQLKGWMTSGREGPFVQFKSRQQL